MKYHYVYRISNIIERKHYYGVRTSDVAPIYDIGINYFSSSTDKSFIKDQNENPQNYKYKVFMTFTSRIDAHNMESLIHKRLNVAKNESFYNLANAANNGFCIIDEDIKQKISNTLRGRKVSKETRKKISMSTKGIKTISDEQRKKISEGLQGHIVSEKTKIKISESKLGTVPWNKGGGVYSEELKEKMAKSAKNRLKVECPHCLNFVDSCTSKRWHFDNCKFKLF